MSVELENKDDQMNAQWKEPKTGEKTREVESKVESIKIDHEKIAQLFDETKAYLEKIGKKSNKGEMEYYSNKYDIYYEDNPFDKVIRFGAIDENGKHETSGYLHIAKLQKPETNDPSKYCYNIGIPTKSGANPFETVIFSDRTDEQWINNAKEKSLDDLKKTNNLEISDIDEEDVKSNPQKIFDNIIKDYNVRLKDVMGSIDRESGQTELYKWKNYLDYLERNSDFMKSRGEEEFQRNEQRIKEAEKHIESLTSNVKKAA